MSDRLPEIMSVRGDGARCCEIMRAFRVGNTRCSALWPCSKDVLVPLILLALKQMPLAILGSFSITFELSWLLPLLSRRALLS